MVNGEEVDYVIIHTTWELCVEVRYLIVQFENKICLFDKYDLKLGRKL